MSAFLGKIHYWLFNKIVWFENLEDKIIELAKDKKIDTEALKKEVENKYGAKLPNDDLENLIDHDNIHGWLQNRIQNAEGRMAAYTYAIMKNDDNALEDMKAVYIDQAKDAAFNSKKDFDVHFDNAVEIYTEVNNYVLDGMPCDRVNSITENSEDKVAWVRTACVHKDVWKEENVDVDVFYELRNAWIETFVNDLNSSFKYTVCENNNFSIERK